MVARLPQRIKSTYFLIFHQTVFCPNKMDFFFCALTLIFCKDKNAISEDDFFFFLVDEFFFP